MWQRRISLFSCSFFLLLFSFSGWSQDISGPSTLAPSELLSQELSLPDPEIPELTSSMTLIDKLVKQLEAWINWYKKVTDWFEEVKTSWNQLKLLLTKQSEQIASLQRENELLKESIKLQKVTYGGTGFAAGFAAGFLSRGLIK